MTSSPSSSKQQDPELANDIMKQNQDELHQILHSGRPKITIPYEQHLKILAPMVRVCTLPFREICQEYGADVVFTEELIDRALLGCERVVNEELGIVEYIHKKSQVPIFQSSPKERNLVLQIGTPNATQALQVGELTYKDYDELALNMGCPKKFSVKGGMGIALLRPEKRETLRDILTTLTRNIDKPISCKIRLLDRMEDTLELVKMLENTGVKAITVHARTIPQRPREPALLDQLPIIKDAATVPIIANGDCFTYSDVDRILELTKCDSVMIARGAMYNASIFQEETVPQCEVAKDIIQRWQRYNCKIGYCKYSLKRMFEQHTKSYPFTILTYRVDTWQQMEQIFDNWEVKIQENGNASTDTQNASHARNRTEKPSSDDAERPKKRPRIE